MGRNRGPALPTRKNLNVISKTKEDNKSTRQPFQYHEHSGHVTQHHKSLIFKFVAISTTTSASLGETARQSDPHSTTVSRHRVVAGQCHNECIVLQKYHSFWRSFRQNKNFFEFEAGRARTMDNRPWTKQDER